jgi:hypothetical protein
MLSCRRVKGPLIFVSVLMHRETNLQVENEEIIEAQSRFQSAVGRNPTALFHLRAQFASMVHGAHRPQCAPFRALASHRSSRPVFSFDRPVEPSTARARLRAVRAYPVSVHERRPLHSAFATERSGKSVGSSPTSATQNREYGWMRRAGRWIAVSRTVEGGRSGAGRRGLLAACGRRRAVRRPLPREAPTTRRLARCSPDPMPRSPSHERPIAAFVRALATAPHRARCRRRCACIAAASPLLFFACFISTTSPSRIVAVEWPFCCARRCLAGKRA